MANAGLNTPIDHAQAAKRLDHSGRLRPSQPAERPECALPVNLSGFNIVALIPAYNEERFIGSVVLKARKYARTVIVVDDGSSDATADVAAEAGAIIFQHCENLGKGAALNSGLRLARDYAPEVVVMLDADGQHLPEELARVAAPVLAGRADVVTGSRYLQRGSRVPRHRAWGHRFFNALTRFASGTACSDSQSGYRAFSPAALEAISFRSNGFSVESEMQFISHENGLRLEEVPITIQYPDKPKRPVAQQGLWVLNGVLRLTGQYRPLLFFGMPGALMLGIGLLWGVGVINIYRRLQQLAVGYAMISLLLSMLGMMLLTTGLTLHSIRGLLTEMLSSHFKKGKNS